MRLLLAVVLPLFPFAALAGITSQTGLSAYPGSPNLAAIDFSSLSATLSTGDYSVGSGLDAVNLYINTPNVTENFTSPGGQHIQGTTPAGEGLVKGALTGVYAPPITGSGGATWTGNYLSTGFGDIVLTFSQSVFGFALLWGSVDATNEIDFLSAGSVVGGVPHLGTTVGTLLGSTIATNPNGSQTYGGSFYTLITSTVSFNQVYLTSNATSFESADFALVVPEPGSLLMGMAGIMLMGFLKMISGTPRLGFRIVRRTVHPWR